MKKLRFFLVAVLAFAILGTTSCRKPYQEERYEEVEPHQTAFVIPLEEGTMKNQATFESEEYLNENKVAAKRIYIPTQWHQTGRSGWLRGYKGEWIPTVRVIKVDRTPVTREWTEEGKGSDGTKKEDIEVESKESIGFGVGITATGSIPEEWAARFLYKYNGRTLEEVMDKDVRGYITNILTAEFGIRDLEACQHDRKAIYDTMRIQTVAYFEDMGIKIMNIGASGGFNYLDPEIQTSINAKFTSAMNIEAADNDVQAAQKFAKASEIIRKQKNLDADMGIKQSLAKAIETGKLPMPNTLVVGDKNFSLIDLYGIQNVK